METPGQNLLNSKLEVLNKRISYQANTWSSISKEHTIYETLLEIQSTKHKQQVTYLRDLLKSGDNEKYSSHKRTLPAITFCGTFYGERQKTKLKSYNYIIVLDVDKLDPNELARTKTCFQNDLNVFVYWESPSKEGLKGLVSLRYNFELNIDNIDRAHKSAFQKLSNHFKEKYNIELDNSGSDTTRLCFFSYDPTIIIKNEDNPFEINDIDLFPVSEKQEKSKTVKLIHSSNQDALNNPKDRNKPGDRYTISAIIKCLEKKKLSITQSYDEWYKVAMAIANTFTYDVGMKCFLKLSSLDKEKYNEINCKNFLLNCYESRSGAVKFSSIVYFANGKGYKTKKQRDRGSEVVDGNLSQVSSSNTANHLPEDLKR